MVTFQAAAEVGGQEEQSAARGAELLGVRFSKAFPTEKYQKHSNNTTESPTFTI